MLWLMHDKRGDQNRHITNEVFTFEVVEGVEHDNILNELYEIRKDQGSVSIRCCVAVLSTAT